MAAARRAAPTAGGAGPGRPRGLRAASGAGTEGTAPGGGARPRQRRLHGAGGERGPLRVPSPPPCARGAPGSQTRLRKKRGGLRCPGLRAGGRHQALGAAPRWGSLMGPSRIPHGSLMGPSRIPHGSLMGPSWLLGVPSGTSS